MDSERPWRRLEARPRAGSHARSARICAGTQSSVRAIARPSKTQIDRAGRLWASAIKRLRAGELEASDLDFEALNEAERIIESWRAYHAKPLSSVAANLRHYVRDHGEPRIAQRLKRFRTIVMKLIREHPMRLTQMADIGGVRAVLPDQHSVRAVARRLRRNWTVVQIRDYIESPKTDGYRALHLIARRWDRLIEIQLRTPFQHVWANLVEETSRRLGYDLKSGEGPEAIRDAYRELAALGAEIEARGGDANELAAVIQAWLARTDRLVIDVEREPQ